MNFPLKKNEIFTHKITVTLKKFITKLLLKFYYEQNILQIEHKKLNFKVAEN